MRGLVTGLASPYPLGQGLPSIYQEEDRFTMRLTEAYDDTLAPIISTLDNLPAYFDPALAPEDFLGWLAGWVALELDETWDVDRRRAAVSRAVDLIRRRGTATGLADEIELATGGEVEVIENGGSAWSLDPSSEMVGSAKPSLVIRVRVADAGSVDRERLERLVRAAKPAHVPHRIEVSGADQPAKARKPRAAAAGPSDAAGSSDAAESQDAAESSDAAESQDAAESSDAAES